MKRSPFYHSVHWPDARARKIDLIHLYQDTLGKKLTTLADPDAEIGTVRSMQTKRGFDTKGKHLRDKYLEIVIEMHKQGMGCRKIMKALRDEYDVSRSFTTIGKWIQEHKESGS